MSNDLRKHINEYMPHIDKILAKQSVPIHNRFIIAGKLFIEVAVVNSTFESTEELFESESYQKTVLPLFNDWYFEKYGELAKGSGHDVYSGIAIAYGQPIALKIPATTTKVLEEGEVSKHDFPKLFARV